MNTGKDDHDIEKACFRTATDPCLLENNIITKRREVNITAIVMGSDSA